MLAQRTNKPIEQPDRSARVPPGESFFPPYPSTDTDGPSISEAKDRQKSTLRSRVVWRSVECKCRNRASDSRVVIRLDTADQETHEAFQTLDPPMITGGEKAKRKDFE